VEENKNCRRLVKDYLKMDKKNKKMMHGEQSDDEDLYKQSLLAKDLDSL
jgi:hypothetical protein